MGSLRGSLREEAVNVLVVSDVDLQDGASGAERVLAAHCHGLTQRGHRVYVIAGVGEGNPGPVEEVRGVEVHRYRRSPGSCLRVSRLFQALSRRVPVDVLIFHQPLSALGILLGRPSRFIAKAYVFHSPWAEEYQARLAHPKTGGKLLRRTAERLALRSCQRIFVLSRFMAAHLASEHPGLEDRAVLLPGGVDLDRFRPSGSRQALRTSLGVPAGSPLLLTVRNLEPRMGLDHLLHAMTEVARALKDVVLLIGGAGPMEHALRGLVERLGLGRSVRCEGYIPEERLAAYYQAADFFILPTRALEGFGLVAVEALACGTPVLGTPVGAIPEILGGLQRDLVFEGSSPPAIASGILTHVERAEADPRGYEVLRQRCRAYAAAGFGWDSIIEQLERELVRLSPAGRGGHGQARAGR
jgi:glycosyltransferase involved in cell wall biosynthesis